MRVALSHLRSLLPIGPEEHLDVEQTVDATSKNAGGAGAYMEKERKKGSKAYFTHGCGRFNDSLCQAG
jgi:uncharacterized protein with von Willebrand factor type A (vWA) domain